jgi:hypothetical protein
MMALEWRLRRSAVRCVVAFAVVVATYVVLYFSTGFSYLAALRTAAALENPQGFRLFSEPVSYLFTRIECVAEILLFFGPFLLVLAVRGISQMTGASKTLFWSSVLTLLAMFATGAFHTAETGRACLFIYPYLVLPVAAHLHAAQATITEQRRLSVLVFAQTLVMQIGGDYFW